MSSSSSGSSNGEQQQQRIPVLAPADVQHAISLIQSAYAPSAATDLPQLQSLQSALLAMQRTPAAWGFVVPLLAQEDANAQFSLKRTRCMGRSRGDLAGTARAIGVKGRAGSGVKNPAACPKRLFPDIRLLSSAQRSRSFPGYLPRRQDAESLQIDCFAVYRRDVGIRRCWLMGALSPPFLASIFSFRSGYAYAPLPDLRRTALACDALVRGLTSTSTLDSLRLLIILNSSPVSKAADLSVDTTKLCAASRRTRTPHRRGGAGPRRAPGVRVESYRLPQTAPLHPYRVRGTRPILPLQTRAWKCGAARGCRGGCWAPRDKGTEARIGIGQCGIGGNGTKGHRSARETDAQSTLAGARYQRRKGRLCEESACTGYRIGVLAEGRAGVGDIPVPFSPLLASRHPSTSIMRQQRAAIVEAWGIASDPRAAACARGGGVDGPFPGGVGSDVGHAARHFPGRRRGLYAHGGLGGNLDEGGSMGALKRRIRCPTLCVRPASMGVAEEAVWGGRHLYRARAKGRSTACDAFSRLLAAGRIDYGAPDGRVEERPRLSSILLARRVFVSFSHLRTYNTISVNEVRKWKGCVHGISFATRQSGKLSAEDIVRQASSAPARWSEMIYSKPLSESSRDFVSGPLILIRLGFFWQSTFLIGMRVWWIP
ncbi:hypothetical protein DFH06DRAFT_1400038 [Mycena polygramma]|nr:hypothetical protein DFH06DRAFT_1400038 [Mycena polygramma]